MSKSVDARHQESAVLTQGIEHIFRKLIRFLIGRMSLVKLQEIVKFIYVEEIENRLKKENPKKNIPLSQFALLSGLDTRTLTKIRNDQKYQHPLYEEINFLDEITPGASILDTWCSTPPFVNSSTGEPDILEISGEGKSFEALFKAATTSRGVTYKSLLKRLAESGAVKVDDESKTVALLRNSYLPTNSDDRLGAMEMGFSALGNMLDTVTHNINSIENGEERFFQRGTWTYRLDVKKAHQVRAELRELLTDTELKARDTLKSHEDPYQSLEQITAGISLFYFEE